MLHAVSRFTVSTVGRCNLRFVVGLLKRVQLLLSTRSRARISYKTYVMDVIRAMNPLSGVNIRRRFGSKPDI